MKRHTKHTRNKKKQVSKNHHTKTSDPNLLISPQAAELFNQRIDYEGIITYYTDSKVVGEVIAQLIKQHKYVLQSPTVLNAIDIYITRFGIDAIKNHQDLKNLIHYTTLNNQLYFYRPTLQGKKKLLPFKERDLSAANNTTVAMQVFDQKLTQLHVISYYVQHNKLEAASLLLENTLKEAKVIINILNTQPDKKFALVWLQTAYITFKHLIRPDKKFEIFENLIKSIKINADILADIIIELNNAPNSSPQEIASIIEPIIKEFLEEKDNYSAEMKTALGNCCYNLSLTFNSIPDYKQAISYLQTALEFLPDDYEVINNLAMLLLHLNLNEAFDQLVNEQIKNKKLATLIKHTSNVANLDAKELLKINDSDVPKDAVNRLKMAQWMSQLNEAHSNGEHINQAEVIKKVTQIQTNYVIFGSEVAGFLTLFIKLGLKTAARYVFKEITEKSLKSNALFQICKVQLTTLNENFINEVKHYTTSNEHKAKLMFIAGVKLFTQKKYSMVEKFVQEGLRYESSLELIKLGAHAAVISRNIELFENYSKLLPGLSHRFLNLDDKKELKENSTVSINNNKKELKLANNQVTNNTAKEEVESEKIEENTTDAIFENYNPREVHEYYKKLKLENAKKIINPETKVKPKWQVKSDLITSNDPDVIKIGEFKGKKCYAKLGNEILKNKATNAVYNKLITAMEHGFTKNKLGSNGIKILKNKNIFELKTASDLRPYTNTAYQDKVTNAWLINFDHVTNHKGISSLKAYDGIEVITTGDVVEY